MATAAVIAGLCLLTPAAASCPFSGVSSGDVAPGHGRSMSAYDTPVHQPKEKVIPPLTNKMYKEIQAELEEVLATSQDFWPADFGSYRGLMLRLSWHCSGTYRQSDGRGGCDGGRIRHLPEFGWEDNTNLDKALRILQPTYDKYAEYISWGDLIVLTGNVAITSSGGKVLGFCGGRQDDVDGTASLALGPTFEQEGISPCEVNGLCEDPLGASTVGLIYVNPQGPIDAPNDPVASAKDIRNIFGNMGFDDRESVAIIGGGHAFGKTHGACPEGAGPGPIESPAAPYPGLCGEGEDRGIGENQFTSGLEGAWTVQPTKWTNLYFQALLEYIWVKEESPAGATQWKPSKAVDPNDTEELPDIRMLTTDIAFIEDEEYLALVKEYADDFESITNDFAATWYRLTSQDMGPASRCSGPDVPPPQAFQDPLPEAPSKMKYVMEDVKGDVEALIKEKGNGAVGDLARLAYNSASTFRATHWFGGANGARIRFAPQSEWEVNEGLDSVIEMLKPVVEANDGLTYADAIVLAGTVAVEQAGGPELTFCPGRVDVDEENASTSVDLSPRTYYLDPLIKFIDSTKIMGLELVDTVALAGRPTAGRNKLSSAFFSNLIENTWVPVLKGDTVVVDPNDGEYESVETGERIPVADYVLTIDRQLREYTIAFAEDEDLLKKAFAVAWTKLMNADRFDGPTGNVCSDFMDFMGINDNEKLFRKM